MALLRRLGPSPLEGRFPLVGLLASAYESIGRRGTTLASTGDAIGLEEPDEVDQAVEAVGEADATIEVSKTSVSATSTPRPLGRAIAKRKNASTGH